jgi:hypothetical protein
MLTKIIIGVSTFALAAFFSCSKAKTSEAEEKENADDEQETIEAGDVAIETNPLAVSYPEGLTVATLNDDGTAEVEIQAQTATVGTVAISYGDETSNALTLTTQDGGGQGVQPQGSGPNSCPVSYEEIATASPNNKERIAANRDLIIQRAEQYAKDHTARSKDADTL